MEILAQQSWRWMLFRHDDGRLMLSVIFGGVLLREVIIALDAPEQALFESGGVEALRPLIERMQSNPSDFRDRHVSL